MKNKARFLWVGLALAVAAAPPAARADFRVWEPMDGIPVRQGYHIEWYRSATADDNGNFCMVWSDTRLGGRDLYGQVVTSDGDHLWDEDGKLLAAEFSRQEDPHVMPDGNGNWIVTWIDYRYDVNIEDKGDVFMMKYDSDGNPMWEPEGGIEICTAPEKQLWVQSFSDGSGGCVSIWIDGRSGNADIYGQHVNASGEIQWEEDGRLFAGGLGDQGSIASANYTADTDGAGGMIFGWSDNRNPTNVNLYANRIDAGGDLVWADSTGMLLCDIIREQKSVRICPDGMGGAFWIWQDARDPVDINLYGQHTDEDGSISWEENGAIICDAQFGQEAPRIVNSSVGEAVTVWEDKREDNVFYDLYAQRISDGAGEPVLHWGGGSSGTVLCDAENNQRQARLYPDGAGGAVFTWVDERFGEEPNNDMYGQRINQTGNQVWGANGIPVSDAFGGQVGNIVRTVTGNRAVIVWLDYRLGSPGLYHQIFDALGNELEQHNGVEVVYGIDGNSTAPQIIPAGGDQYFLAWEDGRLGSLGAYPYVQKIYSPPVSQEPEFLFPENGSSITPGFPFQEDDTTVVTVEDLALTADGEGGIIAVWKDSRAAFLPLLYAQRMNGDGEVLWGDRGTEVAYEPGGPVLYDQEDPILIPADDGGVFIVYTQLNEDFYKQILAQRLDGGGEGQWSEDGNPGVFLTTIPDEDHSLLAFERFAGGSMLVVYQRNDESNDKDLFAVRVNEDGTMPWPEPLVVCEEDGLQARAKAVPVDGGIAVVWEDQRRGQPILDLYAQLISPDGSMSWDDNGTLFIEEDNQQNEVSLASTGDGAQSFWMVWKTTEDGLHEDIKSQRYDVNGGTLLDPPAGITLGVDEFRQQTPRTLIADEGGVFVVWEEEGEQAFSDIRFLHLDADGVIEDGYDTNGDYLTQAYHRQSDLALVDDGDIGFISLWVDNRSTGKEVLKNLYMQRVNEYYSPVDARPAQVPLEMELAHAYPNPFNPSTKIGFTIERDAFVRLVVYDVLGREVTRLVHERLRAGEHEVTWNGRSASGLPVASGTYFYRLEVNGELITRSMVLLK
ncbi:MAG: hypothetical protein MAG453_00336 [Calditrichaeota bacterium]|nr:hypothetical protein [Calditrichota bacterium]